MTQEEERQIKRLAGRIFRKYCLGNDTFFLTFDDLVHDGIIGLLKARKDYKSEMGVPFGAYAEIRIHGAIMDPLRKNHLIKLPQEKQKQVRELLKAKQMLVEKGDDPKIETLSQSLGWDKKKIMETETYRNRITSIDDDRIKNPIIQFPSKDDLESIVLNKDLGKILDLCVKNIENDTERMVFMAREYKQMTLKQVSRQFGVSIETARNRHNNAKQSMKSCLEHHGWDLQ